MRIANARPEPIPAYAEMSSINPVFLMPAALAARAESIGRGFADSLTMGRVSSAPTRDGGGYWRR